MANTITGRILSIGNVETIPSKNGDEPFKKRVVVLNCTRMDFGKTYENYPSFEFSGKHVDDPKDFKNDDIVTISYVIQGTRYQKDGQPEKFFNTVSGYKIEHYQRGQRRYSPIQEEKASSERSIVQPVTNVSSSEYDNTNRVNECNDDLPF